MGRIEKYPLERLKDKNIKVSFDCPLCNGTRIEMRNSDDIDFWKGVKCTKCNALVLLDSMSLAVIRDEPTPKGTSRRTP